MNLIKPLFFLLSCVLFLQYSCNAAYNVLPYPDKKATVEVRDYTGPVTKKTGEVLFFRSEDSLIVTGKVYDTNIISSPDLPEQYSTGYEYDSIELWVNNHHYCAGFASGQPALWSFNQKSLSKTGHAILSEMTARTDGYLFEITIPWKELGIKPAVGSKIKLAFGINNFNAIDDKGTQNFIPENYVWNDISSFADAVLTIESDTTKYPFTFRNKQATIKYPPKTAMQELKADISLTNTLNNINRKIFGVCAHKPPWTDPIMNKVKVFVQGSSTRVWARGNKNWDSAWGKLLRYTKPAWTLGFTDNAWHPEKANYISTSKNNLFDYQQPASYLKRLAYAQKCAGYSLDAFEVWNEPEFKVNGNWPPLDMARYVTDVSKTLKKAYTNLEVGAFLCDAEWNKKFLKAIPENIIDFVDHHYYNTLWFHIGTKGKAAYSGKVIYTPIFKRRIVADLNIIKQYAPNSLKLVCSEWGIHPQTYKAPYNVCHDIGSVIYHASALLTFLDTGIYSAQFFKLSDNKRDIDHFRLINQTHPDLAIGNLLLFQSFGQYFKGKRISLTVNSPEFHISGIETKDYPEHVSDSVLYGAAALWNDNKHICIVFINKHISQNAEISLSGLNSEWDEEKCFAIKSNDIDSDNIFIEPLETKIDFNKLTIPKRSITFILLTKGKNETTQGK